MGLVQLEKPLTAFRTSTAAYVQADDGYRIFTVAQGKPCALNVIDVLEGKCIESYPLHGTNHSWGICSTNDGSVFIGGDGYLYRYDPVLLIVENCGLAIEGETYFWRLASDTDGNVYGGTYPGGKVFQYNPITKMFRDYGNVVEGDIYARSLDVGPNNKVYVGTGAIEAAIIEIDSATGEKRRLPKPAGQDSCTFVYDLDVHDGKLFARYTDTSDLMVYDLSQEQWVCRIDKAMGYDVSPPSDEHKVYLMRDNHLHSFDLNTYEINQLPLDFDASACDFGWIHWSESGYPGQSLISLYPDGFFIYNPLTQNTKHVEVDFVGVPVGIHSLTVGNDGNVYIGGYFAGGFSSYNPVTSKFGASKRFGQSENLFYFKEKLYMGVYPGAHIYQYDPKQSWISDLNPRIVFSLKKHGQDRPFAFTAADDLLAVGTVPAYGKLGGSIAFYDQATNQYEVFANPVYNQSVIALCYSNGFVYGGSSVYGGLGCPPSEQEGKLFIWDVNAKRKVWEGVPVEGERAVTALTVDGIGKIWGMTSGHLFKFNPISQSFEHVYRLFKPIDWDSIEQFWRGVYIQYDDSSGLIYGNCIDKLFQFNIRTEQLQVLATGVSLFGRDEKGTMYAVKDTELYQFIADEESKSSQQNRKV